MQIRMKTYLLFADERRLTQIRIKNQCESLVNFSVFSVPSVATKRQKISNIIKTG
jgi:hypothetical protein